MSLSRSSNLFGETTLGFGGVFGCLLRRWGRVLRGESSGGGDGDGESPNLIGKLVVVYKTNQRGLDASEVQVDSTLSGCCDWIH